MERLRGFRCDICGATEFSTETGPLKIGCEECDWLLMTEVDPEELGVTLGTGGPGDDPGVDP